MMLSPQTPHAQRERNHPVVTIGMNYFVIPGKEQVFEDACAKVIETMNGIDGRRCRSWSR